MLRMYRVRSFLRRPHIPVQRVRVLSQPLQPFRAFAVNSWSSDDPVHASQQQEPHLAQQRSVLVDDDDPEPENDMEEINRVLSRLAPDFGENSAKIQYRLDHDPDFKAKWDAALERRVRVLKEGDII